MIALTGVAKLSTSPKVTIFSSPVPYPFISDQVIGDLSDKKGDRWANSIVAMDLQNLKILNFRTVFQLTILRSFYSFKNFQE